eukprot:6361774-Prymnesium_polylepis.1
MNGLCRQLCAPRLKNHHLIPNSARTDRSPPPRRLARTRSRSTIHTQVTTTRTTQRAHRSSTAATATSPALALTHTFRCAAQPE